MPLSFAVPLQWEIIPFIGNRILLLTDEFGYLISQDGAAQTVTIPPNSDVPFQVGTQISCKQGGMGVVSFVAGAGVMIESRGALLDTNGQFAVTSIVQDSANLWSLFGDTA